MYYCKFYKVKKYFSKYILYYSCFNNIIYVLDNFDICIIKLLYYIVNRKITGFLGFYQVETILYTDNL